MMNTSMCFSLHQYLKFIPRTPLSVHNAASIATARIRANIQKVIVGKNDVIDLALIAALCEGHC